MDRMNTSSCVLPLSGFAAGQVALTGVASAHTARQVPVARYQ
ncbi:hypothetical protein [Methylobacter sp.]